jgi:DNA-binding NtrC family response regulator
LTSGELQYKTALDKKYIIPMGKDRITDMNVASPQNMRAIVFVQGAASSEPTVQILNRHGFQVHIATDYESALQKHRETPFHLAVVEEAYESRPASAVIQELLKIAWTTNAIVISKTDESQLHEETEGLGILGSIRDVQDVGKLEELLGTLKKILGQSSH